AMRCVCYYTNWAQYRPGKGKFLPENINPNLCTHIIYAFAKPEGLDLKPFEHNDDSTEWSEGMYARVIKVKAKNPNVKILLAAGGWNMGSEPFIPLVQTPQSRSVFTKNLIQFLRKRNFDGFDMDWEYPAARGSTPEDKPKFQLLMEEIMRAFKEEGTRTHRTRLMLTVAVGAGKPIIDASYFAVNLSKTVDFISIMTYDFHGSWEKFVGFNSPLFAHPNETEPANQLNVDWAAKYYVSLGVQKADLNIGIATYGRSFTLEDAKRNSILSPATGAGTAGTFTKEAGVMAYYEICDLAAQGGQIVQERSQKNPYIVKDDQWVGYDDVASVTAKACYANKNGYGGILIWAIDFDDFLGRSCNQGQFPLLTAAYNAFIHPTADMYVDFSISPILYLGGFRFVCYYTNWAQYRPGNGKFMPEDIDPELCTHLIYAFAKPVGLDLHPFEHNDDDSPWSEGMYRRVIKIKSKKPGLKVLLAAGGYNMGSEPFIPLVQTEESRLRFSENVLAFLRKRQFDGFDMDWEYPAARGSPSGDKARFQLLMEELKRTFDHEAEATGRQRLLLTVAVPAGKENIDNGYEVQKLANVVDFISIMSYDLHGAWENYLGFNSPLYPYPTENTDQRRLNVDWAARYYVSLGAPKKKLNIGIATYGRSFQLVETFDHSILSPAAGAGRRYPYSREAGIMAYYEICEFIKNESATVVNVPSQGNPYAFKDTHWVGYDDVASVKAKACYAKSNGYGGILFWTLDFDDFNGHFCKQGKYPLLNAAKQEVSSLS
ncbi:unnamed protein product, partial [Candidula unifasciata]